MELAIVAFKSTQVADCEVTIHVYPGEGPVVVYYPG
jgi:hypothetical protein